MFVFCRFAVLLFVERRESSHFVDWAIFFFRVIWTHANGAGGFLAARTLFSVSETQHNALSEHFPNLRKIPTWNDKFPETPRPFLVQQAMHKLVPVSFEDNAMDCLSLSLSCMMAETTTAIIQASSVLKKRRRRMNAHKHKKWLRKMKFRLRSEGRK
jgi:hypothetical protein